MPKKPSNHNKRWSLEEIDQLKALLETGKTTSQAAGALKRTRASVWTKKHQLELEGRFTSSKGYAGVRAATADVRPRKKRKEAQADYSSLSLESLAPLIKNYGLRAVIEIDENAVSKITIE
jgi:hypothetical protein